MQRLSPTDAPGPLAWFARHPTAANLVLVVMLVAGLLAIPQMRAQFFPDTQVDSISVSVRWDGAGAEDVDRAIMELLEPALLAVDGVSGSNAISREGSARVSLEFEPGHDMGVAEEDVGQALDLLNNLPEEAEIQPVTRSRWSDQVTEIVITGPVGVDQLGRFADELTARLFAEGVTRTTIRGIAAPEIRVEVKSLDLIRHDVTMEAIARAIAAEIRADPAGDIQGANARIRTGVEKRSAAEIGAIVLRAEPGGATLTIADVARVETLGIDRERAYFVGESPAITLRVDRSVEGDAIRLQRAVEEVAETMAQSLPDGVSIDLIRSRAEFITGRLDILIDNALMGLGLVVVLLFLFLSARTAFWVALGIPAALAAAIALMWAGGLTINMISLFALIITLGIIVDDAIVVGEHADWRARHLGEHPMLAAERAAARMARPVAAATLTTVIAFFALVAIGGRFGDLIADIPFTVVAVLLASLVECFLVLPNHMAHALAGGAKQAWYDWPSRQVNRGFAHIRERAFKPLMRLVIRGRYVVLATTLLILATQMGALIRGDVPWRFFNAPEQGSVTGNFTMLPGATRDDTLAMMREMQAAAARISDRYTAEHGRDPIAYAIAEIGGNTGRALTSAEGKTPDQLGALSLELIDADLRPYSSFAFVADLQREVRHHPMAEEVSFRGWRSGPGGDAIAADLFGADSATLKEAAEALKARLATFPEVSALEDSLAYDKDELVLELTPQGEALGFTIDALGRVLRQRLGGIEAASFPVGPRSGTVRVEIPESELTADFIDSMQLRAPSGAYVPLADLVRVERQSGFAAIRRENGLRLVSVTGDLSEDDPDRAAEVMRAIEAEILPDIAARYQLEWQLSGLAEDERAFLADARTGLILCLLGIFAVLALVFGSWTRPLVVMAIIPFGLVGAIWGHGQWDVALSLFSVVGLLGMTGIIINDSIVLTTTIDEYAETRGILPAIVDGTADRLRPVFLTTATTVLGLLPLLFERSSQAQFLKPTVITLVYGLGFGMVLVLLVVPALIACQEDLRRLRRSFTRALFARNRRMAWLMRSAGALTLVALGATLNQFGASPAALSWFMAGVIGIAVLTAGIGRVLLGRTRVR